MYPIRIFSNVDLGLIAEVDNYESIIFERKLYSAGVFTIYVDFRAKYATEFQKNRIIAIGNSQTKCGIIKSIEYMQNGNEEKLKIQGFELKGIFKQRITIPDTGQSHIEFSTDPAETILKTLVQKNQDITAMAFDLLEVVTDSARGATGTTKSRYRNLADELERIGRAKEMGNKVYIDYATSKLKFDIIEVVDKTSTVVFSTEYNNIKSQIYNNSDFNVYNYAYILGQGTGAGRTLITTGDSVDNFELSVMAIDARDINDTDSLTSRAQEQLAETKTTITFDCEVAETKPFTYETDWDLGTKVTIKADSLGLTFQKIIEEITEYYTLTEGRRIDVTFGTPQKNIKKYIDINTTAAYE